jgi:hypothetical protein
MRWKSENNYPEIGWEVRIRIIEKFLLFPIKEKYKDGYEWRWLEKVKIKQKFHPPSCVNDYISYWENIEFLD